jgi:hypothetical protein
MSAICFIKKLKSNNLAIVATRKSPYFEEDFKKYNFEFTTNKYFPYYLTILL